MTIHWKAVEQYFTVVQIYPLCNNCGKCINFELGAVRSKRGKSSFYVFSLGIACTDVAFFFSYAKTVGAKHFHTSAKLNKGIEEMFFELSKSKSCHF